jgi:hypothetical protein
MVESYSYKQEQRFPLETVNLLNKKFSKGESPWKEDTLRELRSLRNPIVLDFNRVLVNQRRPWVANPEAKIFLNDLVNLGTVLVITNNFGDWDLRHRSLKGLNLWHKGMILMTLENCSLTRQTAEEKERRSKEIDTFMKLRNFPQSDWSYNKGKRVAPLFMKNYDIPIIDDDEDSVVLNNPGMLGIKVQDFTTDGKKLIHGIKGISLEEALRIVKKHYNSPGKI